MQNSENSESFCVSKEEHRASPDITCITFYNNSSSSQSSSNRSSSNSVSNPSTASTPVMDPSQFLNMYPNNNNNNSLHLNPISEVPAGYYEYVFGENGEVRILCKICQYVSNKKSNFKRHFTNMHFEHEDDSSKPLECCGIRFRTKGEKFHHTKSVHKSGYKCNICPKVFDRPALLQRHVAKHTGKKPYKCSLCSYQTPNKANAKRHIEKRHSDVQEGFILFVTEDGEQIQMEVVSKTEKELNLKKEQSSAGESSTGSSPSSFIPVTPRVVLSNLGSTSSYGSVGEISPSSSLKTPRPPSATVTSSTLSSPGCYQPSNLSLEEQKQQMNHAIDKILNSGTGMSPTSILKKESATTPAVFSTPQTRGNPIPYRNPENVAASSAPSSPLFPFFGCNHYGINQLHFGSHCFPDWSRTSSPFPLNDYARRRSNPFSQFSPYHLQQQPSFISPGATTATVPFSAPAPTERYHQLRNGSSPLLFRQCVHGCWHHIPDNQNTSDYVDSRGSFNFPSNLLSYSSPDLRSSSSLSLNTENSSIISFHKTENDDEEDDEDSDSIDVVGDSKTEDEVDSSTSNRLSSICEGLGSCSTAEIPLEPKVEVAGEDSGEMETSVVGLENPPVDSVVVVPSRRISFDESMNRNDEDAVDDENESVAAASHYVPKKLRVSKAYTRKYK